MSYSSADDWKLAIWPPSSEDSLFARRIIATAFHRIAERILCSISRLPEDFSSCSGGMVLRYGVVAREDGLTPVRRGSLRSLGSRYRARSRATCAMTAFRESTHSYVSPGS